MEEERERERGWRRAVRERAGQRLGNPSLPLSSGLCPCASDFNLLEARFLIYELRRTAIKNPIGFCGG